MRIAVAGIHTECSTWNPIRSRLDDFRVLRGAALLAHPDFAPLQAFAHDFVPLLHARAVPGGPVEAATYASLKAEMLALLAAMPICGCVVPKPIPVAPAKIVQLPFPTPPQALTSPLARPKAGWISTLPQPPQKPLI